MRLHGYNDCTAVQQTLSRLTANSVFCTNTAPTAARFGSELGEAMRSKLGEKRPRLSSFCHNSTAK